MRHSGAKNTVIDISADDSLIVFIADDGVGIPEEIRRGANGIANMKRRISDIGGTMTLVSNAGTSIYFRLPMPKNPSFTQ